MEDAERNSERATQIALLTGEITEETHPNSWRDDVYMFSTVSAWKNDTAWMLQQMANSAYTVTLRAQTAFLNQGDSRAEAYEAIAKSSSRFSDGAGAAAPRRGRAAQAGGAVPQRGPPPEGDRRGVRGCQEGLHQVSRRVEAAHRWRGGSRPRAARLRGEDCASHEAPRGTRRSAHVHRGGRDPDHRETGRAHRSSHGGDHAHEAQAGLGHQAGAGSGDGPRQQAPGHAQARGGCLHLDVQYLARVRKVRGRLGLLLLERGAAREAHRERAQVHGRQGEAGPPRGVLSVAAVASPAER